MHKTMLSDVLIPRLRERYPGRGLRIESGDRPSVVFPAAHPDVGDVTILDDGDELTLIAGRFTHVHFSDYDNTLTPAEKAEEIVVSIVDFLDDLFADRIVLWGSHRGSGGSYRRGYASELSGSVSKKFVWSGPLED